MKISLILPYWDRQEAADKALAALWTCYSDMLLAGRLEIVLVDDGSPTPFIALAAPWFKLVRLPAKDTPKSPVTCWNEGVKAATGDLVAISCVEVIHTYPVLEQMAEAVAADPLAYVLAAAYCPELQEWHCHTTKRSRAAPELPKGCGRAFLGMMRKDLYWKAGGWDEDYRDGAGYEDIDFVYRMLRAGAKFQIRDDLVVVHPKDGAVTHWPAGAFERNKALLAEKWPRRPAVTFACVQAQNYCGRGAQYVNTLYDMVCRNMPVNQAFRFVCLTDDPAGLADGIETLALPPDLEGWYGKLYLFRRGLFPNGSRVVFLDLDTLIVGRLDDLASYAGQFATLSDFYEPSRLGPAIMAWEAGDYAASIWDEWAAQGKPRNAMGDLWWLNNLDQGRFARRADKLQDLYPGQFVSFKKHCHPLPPKGARFVCFHGIPRPHEVTDGVVEQVWKVGGLNPADLEFIINTKRDQVAENIRAACKLDCPWLEIDKPHAGDAAIVGGGPSLASFLDELREKMAAGAQVYAVNGAFRYLSERGIRADWHVIIDARPENAAFVTEAPGRGYLLASQCAPETFAKAMALAQVTVVHMHTDGVMDSIPASMKPVNLISSGITVGLAALALSYCKGARRQFLYGMDSSYEDDHHAYPQAGNDADAVIEATVGGRKFKCAPWMVEQAQGFQTLAHELAQDGCEIHVRSFGLLGHVAWLMAQEREAA